MYVQKRGLGMKLIKDIDVKKDNSLRAGCVCSSGRTSTRGPWDPIYNCNCSCDHGTKNYNRNFGKADAHKKFG